MKRLSLLQTSTLPIGLEFCSTGAKLLQLKRRQSAFSVIDALRVDSPMAPDGDEDPREWFERTFKALSRRLGGASFKGKRCVIGLGQDVLRIRSIRQPRMPQDEADRAIRFEAPDRLGFGEDQHAEIGWVRAGEVRQSDEVRDEVIVVAAETELLEWIVDQTTALGLRPVAIEPSFVAAARCFERVGRRAADDSVVRVLLDIGAGSTDLIVLRGTELVFYKSLKISGSAMNQVVAERLGLAPHAAAELRRQRIRPGRRTGDGGRDERTEQAIFEAIRPLIDELGREVSMCMRYYAVSFSGRRPSFALLVGGDACEPRLIEHLERVVSLPIHIGRPLEGVELNGSLKGNRRSTLTEWTVAAGLSLHESPVSIERLLIADAPPNRDEKVSQGEKEAA